MAIELFVRQDDLARDWDGTGDYWNVMVHTLNQSIKAGEPPKSLHLPCANDEEHNFYQNVTFSPDHFYQMNGHYYLASSVFIVNICSLLKIGENFLRIAENRNRK